MKQIAVILSGCGVFDGSEIHEAVLTLLAIDQANAGYQCFAPDVDQYHVMNHLTGEETVAEKRNVLVESARIARGEIKSLSELVADEFDAVIFPGGFGVAKNLSTYAINTANYELNTEVKMIAIAFAEAQKVAGYLCIAPIMLPLIYQQGIQATIGNDIETAKHIQQQGGEHINCAVDDIVIDADKKVVTTPAYMLAQSISEAYNGITKLVNQVLRMS